MASSSTAATARVPAWDLPTRLFKWGFVVAVALAWTTQWLGDRWLNLHKWNGYAILVLLCFRLLWGVVGSSTARFSSWVRWPTAALRYGAALLRGEGRPYLGHNPLGAWMILALLALVGAQAITGLFTVDSNGMVGGPFANLEFGDPTDLQRLMTRWHFFAFNVILVFASIHILANVGYQLVKKDPVVQAMIVGTKPAEPFADEPAMRRPPHLAIRAILCLAASVVVVLGAIRLGGGTL